MHDFFVNYLYSFLAGGCAGCAVDLTLFPLDTIKTRLQSNKPISFKNFYSGISWTLLASFPCSATFWSSYLSMKWVLEKNSQPDSTTPFFSAIFASMCTSLVRSPFEVVKQQMQVGMHDSAFRAPVNIFRAQGLRGLYAGVFTLISREIPFDTIQMLVYEYLRAGRDLDIQISMANGAIAGGISAFITTPNDVAKTKVMTDGGRGNYTSFFQTIKLTAQEGGIGKLWTGWHLRVIYTTFGGMVFFGTFEAVMKTIRAKE